MSPTGELVLDRRSTWIYRFAGRGNPHALKCTLQLLHSAGVHALACEAFACRAAHWRRAGRAYDCVTTIPLIFIFSAICAFNCSAVARSFTGPARTRHSFPPLLVGTSST